MHFTRLYAFATHMKEYHGAVRRHDENSLSAIHFLQPAMSLVLTRVPEVGNSSTKAI